MFAELGHRVEGLALWVSAVDESAVWRSYRRWALGLGSLAGCWGRLRLTFWKHAARHGDGGLPDQTRSNS